MKKLLGIFAHPDDESAVAGGTIAKYAKTGWTVDIVTATRGEAGQWGDVPDTLGTLEDVRSKELEEAAGFLGIRSVTFLDQKDGKLSALLPGKLEDDLVRAIREAKPDVIITHEPGGVTNHPDHIKMSYAATFGYQAYAKIRAQENPGDPNPPKLYYACIPETVMSYLVKARHFPAEMFDRPLTGVEDKRITTVIDIKRFAASKRKALEAYRTQRPILEKYIGVPGSPFMRQEYFVLRMVGETEVYMGKNDRVSDRL